MATTHAQSTERSRKTIFRISDLVKTYEMGEVTVRALRGVTLDIYEGEFVVILGPSGSGKSTLLNIVGGIDGATSGDVHFRDQALSRLDESDLTKYRRDNIGFIFQFYNLMSSLSAKENVEMATEISSDPMNALDALDLVKLRERADHFPAQLSGGEQQRVAIARAVAKRPEILLCDEPTGALDISTGKIVLDVLNDVNVQMGTTLIVITHNAAIGEIADRVIRMADGDVREVIVHESRKGIEEVEW